MIFLERLHRASAVLSSRSSFTTKAIWWVLFPLVGGLYFLYLSVLPDHLVIQNYAEDGGDFLSAMLTKGIPHPTGYPTYILLGRLFLLFPFSTPYFRVALLSAVAAALACGLLYFALATRIEKNWLGIFAAVVAALAWGTSKDFWSQAAIVEVHALQSLFIVVVLGWILLLAGWRYGRPKIPLLFLAFVFGLALGNHITILLLAPLLLFMGVKAWRQGLGLGWIVGQMVFIGLGGLVYLYLPLSAQSYPPINWGNPQTWNGFWWQISGQPYQGLLFDMPSAQFLQRIPALARLLLEQFGVPGMVVGIIGATLSPYHKGSLRTVCVWVVFTYALFSLGYNTADAMSYLLPVWMIFSVWIGFGMIVLNEWVWRRIPIGLLVNIALVIFLLVRIPATFSQVDAREDWRLVNFAESLLDGAPQDAIIFTESGQDSFPLWYAHFGMGRRPDLRVIVLPLTQFVWYQETLTHVYPDLRLPSYRASETAEWGDQIPGLNPLRSVCHSQPGELGIQWYCE